MDTNTNTLPIEGWHILEMGFAMYKRDIYKYKKNRKQVIDDLILNRGYVNWGWRQMLHTK